MTAPASGEADFANRLVIAYAFPPYAEPTSFVAAHRVREFGEPVDLLQNDMGGFRKLDPGSEFISDDLIRRRRALPTRSAVSGWWSITEFCDEGIRTLNHWEQERATSYRTVYSRAPFVASHFLAARYVERSAGAQWEAEFAEPLSLDVRGRERYAPVREGKLLDFCRHALRARGFRGPDSDNVYEWCEHLTYAVADRLLFTNPRQRAYMLSAVSDSGLAGLAADKSVIAPQPLPEASMYSIASPRYHLPPGVVHIGYFGSLLPSHGSLALLNALADLDERDRSRLRLHLFVWDAELIRKRVTTLGLATTVAVNDPVPHLEALALTRMMDVLLAIDVETPAGVTENPVRLAKWSEYLGSGTAVWGIVSERSELSDHGAQYLSPRLHVTAIQQTLVSLARDGVSYRA